MYYTNEIVILSPVLWHFRISRFGYKHQKIPCRANKQCAMVLRAYRFYQSLFESVLANPFTVNAENFSKWMYLLFVNL